jgi:hypothetical protein
VEERVSGLNILLSNVLAAYCGAKKKKKKIFHREGAKVLRHSRSNTEKIK